MNRLSQILASLRGGLVDIELSKKHKDVLEAVRRSGSKGSITLTITFDPKGEHNTEIHTTCKYSTKTPPDPGSADVSILFLNNNNDLVRDNAVQQGLRGVDGGDNDRADGSSPAEQRFGH